MKIKYLTKRTYMNKNDDQNIFLFLWYFIYVWKMKKQKYNEVLLLKIILFLYKTFSY